MTLGKDHFKQELQPTSWFPLKLSQ